MLAFLSNQPESPPAPPAERLTGMQVRQAGSSEHAGAPGRKQWPAHCHSGAHSGSGLAAWALSTATSGCTDFRPASSRGQDTGVAFTKTSCNKGPGNTTVRFSHSLGLHGVHSSEMSKFVSASLNAPWTLLWPQGGHRKDGSHPGPVPCSSGGDTSKTDHWLAWNQSWAAVRGRLALPVSVGKWLTKPVSK